MYRHHLSTSSDLITSQEETRTEFISLALEKSRLATPIIEQARAIRVSAMSVKQASYLMKDDELKPVLLAAAGVSDKAARHMLSNDRDEVIIRFVSNVLEPVARIKAGFDKQYSHPCLFFVGAVIVSNMATEIWSQLETGNLKNAANLTKSKQLTSLCCWLCGL